MPHYRAFYGAELVAHVHVTGIDPVSAEVAKSVLAALAADAIKQMLPRFDGPTPRMLTVTVTD